MNQPFGIGTDIIEISRIEAALARNFHTFTQKLFTPTEIEYCQNKTHPPTHFAARFAAKEAIAKALGTGFGKSLAWLDIEISRDLLGKPTPILTGTGAQFLTTHHITAIHLSLSHTHHYATAHALAWQS